MKDKKLNSLIDKFFSKCLDGQRNCIVGGCTENAINSHLLQKNGIINLIAENQHVRQVNEILKVIKYGHLIVVLKPFKCYMSNLVYPG